MDLAKKKHNKNNKKSINKASNDVLDNKQNNKTNDMNSAKNGKEDFDPTHKLMQRFTGKIDLDDLNINNISQAQEIFNRFGDKTILKDEDKKDIEFEENIEYDEDYIEDDYEVKEEVYEDSNKINKTGFIGKVKNFLGLSEGYYEDEDRIHEEYELEPEDEKILDDEAIINEGLIEDEVEGSFNDTNSESEIIAKIDEDMETKSEVSVEKENLDNIEDIEEKQSSDLEEIQEDLSKTQELNLISEEEAIRERIKYTSKENDNRKRIKEYEELSETDIDINEEDGKIINAFVRNVKSAIQSTVDDKEEEKQRKAQIKAEKKEEKLKNKPIKNIRKKSPKKEKKENNSSGKAKKVGKYIGLVAVIALIVFAGYTFIESGSKLTLEEIYPSFAEALENKDEDKLSKILKVDGLGRDPNELEIGAFLKLTEEEKSYKEDILAKLNEDLEKINEGEYSEEDAIIKIVKDGKKNFFTEAYAVEVGESKAKSNNGNILIKNGEDTEITDEGVNITPGIYDGTQQYGILKLSNPVILDNRYLTEGIMNINFDESDAKIVNEKYEIAEGDSRININSSKKNALVFINEENTELTVKEFNKLDTQNIKIGDKINLVASFPWGYGISESKEITSQKDSVSIPVEEADENIKNKFIDIIKQTLKEDELAYETGDLSVLNTITGTQMDRLKSWINGNKSYGSFYIRDYRELEIDMDSFQVGKNWQGPGYVGYMGGYLTYGEQRYNKNYEKKPEKENLPVKNRQRVGFHFKWMEEEQQWKIYMWGNTYRPISSRNLEKIDLK